LSDRNLKTTGAQKIEEAKAAFLAASSRRQTRAALLTMLTVVVVVIVPRFVPAPFDVVVMMVGGTILLSANLSLFPDSFRSRGGSLAPALGLVGAMLVAAVVITVLLLSGI
jgi:hypothetical protein